MVKLELGEYMKEKFMKLKEKLDLEFVRFLIVGTINTVVGTSIMFIAYNVLGLSYWASSASNYFLASILSYFLNKYFTFKSKIKNKSEIFRFVINILICYLLAYGIAQPLTQKLLSGASVVVRDNVSMVIGMVLYVFLNYFGQRIFVFKDK